MQVTVIRFQLSRWSHRKTNLESQLPVIWKHPSSVLMLTVKRIKYSVSSIERSCINQKTFSYNYWFGHIWNSAPQHGVPITSRIWNSSRKSNKKLSCRRQTVQCFVSLNILLSHSRSFEITLLRRVLVNPYDQYFNDTMSVCRAVSEIFIVKKWRDLETGGRGRSRSLKMAPFDRWYTTFYWSAIVNGCCTIFKLFDTEWSWPWKGHWRSFKLVPFESLGAVSISLPQ